MKIFISGGSNSGKSSLAESLAQMMRKPSAPLYYVATMIPSDNEDEARIRRHQQARVGSGFETIEAGTDILGAIDKYDRGGTFLLDSVTALLANEMFAPDGVINVDAYIKLAAELENLLCQVGDIVIVSDSIYSDAAFYDSYTEKYRSGLAFVGKKMAIACDVLIEACFGAYTLHKGSHMLPNFGKL